MKNIDINSTAEAIEAMAARAEEAARDLRRIAESMRRKSDITYAAEATALACNLMNIFRLDLLVTRPIREYQKDVA